MDVLVVYTSIFCVLGPFFLRKFQTCAASLTPFPSTSVSALCHTPKVVKKARVNTKGGTGGLLLLLLLLGGGWVGGDVMGTNVSP